MVTKSYGCQKKKGFGAPIGPEYNTIWAQSNNYNMGQKQKLVKTIGKIMVMGISWLKVMDKSSAVGK